MNGLDLERLLAKLDRVDERVADMRVALQELRGDIANVRALIDGVHSRAAKLETDHESLAARVRVLEDDATASRGHAARRTLTQAGAAAGGGGLVAALIELLRAML